MIVRNNRPRKDYLIYKISGVTKRKIIDAYSTLDIPEITDINQIVLSLLRGN